MIKNFNKILYKFSNQNILSGIRVLDLSRIISGPLCSMQLSDLGAEVIKIESFDGDESRKWGPPFTKNQDSTYFLSINRNKKSICVDLKQKKGQQLIYDLAKKSDIFLENFSPGITQKLKLDYKTIREINNMIIYASITGFGSKGPSHNKVAFDLIMQATSGYMDITGNEQDNPVKFGFAITDILTSLYTANGILAALIQRGKTQQGLFLETSLLESSVASLINIWSQYLNGNKVAKRMGNHHQSIAPYGVFNAKDNKKIVIGTITDPQFYKLCKLLDIDGNIITEKFKTNKDRVKNREQLTNIIEKKLQEIDLQKFIKQMDDERLPCGINNSIDEVFDDEQVKALGLVQEINSQNYGPIKQVRSPLNFGEQNLLSVIQEPPLLNQHKNYVLKEILAYDEDYLQILMDEKVIK